MVDGHVGDSTGLSIRLVYGMKGYGSVARGAVHRVVVASDASIACASSCLQQGALKIVCGEMSLDWPRV